MSFMRPIHLRPVVSPTRVNHVNTMQPYIVPHIHPSHTHFHHHKKFIHKHFYPHTTSASQSVSHHHVQVPGPVGPVRRPFF